MRTAFVAALAAGLSCSHAAPPAAPDSTRPASRAIERSNENAQLLLAVQAKFMPEQAARTGVAVPLRQRMLGIVRH